MSGVVFIVYIPTEEHEKSLIQRVKKKVAIRVSPKKIHHISLDPLEEDFVPIHKEDLNEKSHNHSVNTQKHEFMQNVLQNILEQLDIKNSTWCKAENDNILQVIFSVECRNRCEEVLDILRQHNIGSHFNSSVSVLPCTIHYYGNNFTENDSKEWDNKTERDEFDNDKTSGWNRFVSSVRARLTVAQVAESVKAKAALTFDFICLILISTILCALGMVENSNIYLLSSMLISPMMGPVMAGTFGSVIQDKRLQKIGVQNELIGLGIATLVGFCYGSVICIITDKYGSQDWPTYEMTSIGELRALWVGCLIALLSGAAVALGILSDNIASLVGVAISTSLMPPAVNAGLMWSIASVYYMKGNETTRYTSLSHTKYYSENEGLELLSLGAISICLTFVNIVCIYVAGILVFKIKEVAPIACRDQERRQFWHHDVPLARDYNKTVQNDEAALLYKQLRSQFKNKREININNDQLYHSTNLTNENSKLRTRRAEYTWSPCTDITNRPNIKEMQFLYNCMKEKSSNSGASKALKFAPNNQHKRLSHIFNRVVPKEDDKDILKTLQEILTEKTPLMSSLNKESQENSTTSKNFVSKTGTRKFVVTPCEQDPLKS